MLPGYRCIQIYTDIISEIIISRYVVTLYIRIAFEYWDFDVSMRSGQICQFARTKPRFSVIHEPVWGEIKALKINASALIPVNRIAFRDEFYVSFKRLDLEVVHLETAIPSRAQRTLVTKENTTPDWSNKKRKVESAKAEFLQRESGTRIPGGASNGGKQRKIKSEGKFRELEDRDMILVFSFD